VSECLRARVVRRKAGVFAFAVGPEDSGVAGETCARGVAFLVLSEGVERVLALSLWKGLGPSFGADGVAFVL